MVYNRNPGESEEEFIYRVCSLKDEIGTWEDVANILNDALQHRYTESAYRKKYQTFAKMMETCYGKNENEAKYLADIEEQTKV